MKFTLCVIILSNSFNLPNNVINISSSKMIEHYVPLNFCSFVSLCMLGYLKKVLKACKLNRLSDL